MLVSKELGGCRTLLCYGGSVVTGLKWQSYFRAFCFGFPFFSIKIVPHAKNVVNTAAISNATTETLSLI